MSRVYLRSIIEPGHQSSDPANIVRKKTKKYIKLKKSLANLFPRRMGETVLLGAIARDRSLLPSSGTDLSHLGLLSRYSTHTQHFLAGGMSSLQRRGYCWTRKQRRELLSRRHFLFLYSAWYIKAPWTGGRQHRSKTWPDCPCALGKDKPFLGRCGRTAEAYPILIPFLSYE